MDPLIDVKDASDANSIASTLKLYLREQQPPLFPFYLFELLTDCAKCLSTSEFINKVRYYNAYKYFSTYRSTVN